MARRLLAALVVLISATTAAAQRVDLRPKLEEGQEFRFLLKQTLNQTRNAPDPSAPGVDYKMTQELGLAFTVKAPPEDRSRAATLEMRIESIKFEMDAGGAANSFDSKINPDDDSPFKKLLEPLLGAVFEVALDPDGNITAIDRTDAGATPSPFTDQLLGADLLTARLGPILTLKQGDGRASVGEYWTTLDEFDASAIGPHQLITKHRIVSHRRRIATIETTGRIIPTSEGAKTPLDVEYAGTYLWDTRQGMLKSLNIDYTLETTFTTPDGAPSGVKTVSNLSVEQR